LVDTSAVYALLDRGDSRHTHATSFALMKRLEVRRALAFDRHFDQFGIDRI
jgi:predicted nucleic acid-binding protein